MSDYQTRVTKEKEGYVENIQNLFENSKDYIFTDYRGLSVSQITELRTRLREEKGTYRVVKNRYAKIALKNLDKPQVDDILVGPTAVALAEEESGALAKVLVDFSKDNPVQIKGGIIEGQVFDASQMEAYSKLPTRAELIAKLMGTLNAPVQHLAFALSGVPSKLVRTLKAVADSK
ncbi:MAG: 50S ribosomal protein L10 [Sediminispirochaetaceae bacterium]